MTYKPQIIKAKCSVCGKKVADFIVPDGWEEAYCIDCWIRERREWAYGVLAVMDHAMRSL